MSQHSTSGYFSKENKNINSERYMHPHVHRSTAYNGQSTDKYPSMIFFFFLAMQVQPLTPQ